MTKILKMHKVSIASAMGNMINNVRPISHMPLDTFLNLFFTVKQREMMDIVSGFVNTEAYHYTNIKLRDTLTTIPDSVPLPENVKRERRIVVGASTSYKGFSPVEWKFHPNASPEDIDQFNRCIEEVTLQGSIRAMWDNIKNYYIDEASSHEEMRYLFPGTVSILRHAGLDDIASMVEDVRNRPAVALDRYMVQVFRHMNQWFATQMVLGTFENNAPSVDKNYVYLYLGGTVHSDGVTVLAP